MFVVNNTVVFLLILLYGIHVSNVLYILESTVLVLRQPHYLMYMYVCTVFLQIDCHSQIRCKHTVHVFS